MKRLQRVLSILSGLNRRQYRVLVWLWIAGILAALSIPLGNIPSMEGAPGLDLAVHLVLFFGLAILSMRAFRPAPDDAWTERLDVDAVWTLGLGTLFAAGTELFQHVVPSNRQADPVDFIADVVGLGLGVAAYVVRRRRTEVES